LSADRIRIAFLGGSHNSAVGRAHRTAIEADRRYELVAGCFSRDQTQNAESAEVYRLDPTRVHSSLETLIQREAGRIDALVILTPTDQHFEQIQLVHEAGIPVICEKALVSNMAQALTLRDSTRAHDHFLAVTYNYTGYPILRELKALIEAGAFGRITEVRAEMPQEGFLKVDEVGQPIRPQGWRLKDGPIPTVSLDLGVHLHVLIKFLTGALPVEVAARSRTRGHFAGLIDSVSCLATYDNGMDASIWFTKTALGHRNGLKLEIYGEHKSAIWIQEHPEQLLMADQQGNRQVMDRASPGVRIANQPRYTRFKAGHPAGFIEAFANYYADIADVLQAFHRSGRFDETPYVFGPDAAIEGIALLDAIALASKTNQWVEVK